MSNHTPGPWTVPARDSGITVNAGNSIVAEVYAVDIGNTQMANAKLIAAAPAMAEALQAVIDLFDNDPEQENIIIRDRVMDALTKAGL